MEVAKLFMILPEEQKEKHYKGKTNHKIRFQNLMHWHLPGDNFRSFATANKNHDVERLRDFAEKGNHWIQIPLEAVYEQLRKEKVEKMNDEEFLQSLCNTGL